jgi:hypothetical protein
MARDRGDRVATKYLPHHGSSRCSAYRVSREVVAAVQAALGIDTEGAEMVVRASEPLWDAMEEVGGLVD